MNETVYQEYIEEIHSFDSYYVEIFHKKNSIVIPFINLGIRKHPLNVSTEMQFIDFAFMVFQNIYYFETTYEGVVINKDRKDLQYFGGASLEEKSAVIDIIVGAEVIFLQLMRTSRLSKEMWIPVDGTQKEINMDINIVKEFCNPLTYPSNVKQIIFP